MASRLAAAELQRAHGYGCFKVVDGACAGLEAMWTGSWPPPEDLLLIIPVSSPAIVVELPEEPEHLQAMREGVSHGWVIYQLLRGDHSTLSDEDALHAQIIRLAQYGQGPVFEP